MSPQATNITYKVDDGTATIDVKQWVDSDAPPEEQKFMPKEDDYVHVWGTLKEFNEKRHVAPKAIHPVVDFNEISYHLLNATAVHLYFTRGPPGQANGAIKTEGGMFVDGDGPARGLAHRIPAGLSATARKVYECLLNSPQNNEGLHVHEIARQLQIPVNDVYNAANDELTPQSLIFPTLDDETWAIMEQ